MDTEVIIQTEKEFYSSKPSVTLHETGHFTLQAKMAVSFVEKWGMVAGKDDGEDSAGRAKLTLMSEQEVVDRAVNMSNLLMEALEGQGLIVEIPSWDDMQSTLKKDS